MRLIQYMSDRNTNCALSLVVTVVIAGEGAMVLVTVW